MSCSSRFTVRSPTRCPCSRSASPNRLALRLVQRSGPDGSPRVAGSTSRSSAFVRPGSRSSARFLPAPGDRCRSDAPTPASSSRRPFAMVTRDIPVASATRAVPPRPNARASVAAHSLRARSSSTGRRSRYFPSIVRVAASSMTPTHSVCRTQPYRILLRDSLGGSPAPRPRAPPHPLRSCPTRLRSVFSIWLKCARRLFTPIVRAKYASSPMDEELGHVAEVAEAVVDGRGREHDHGLGAFRVVEQLEQAVVARRFDFAVGVTLAARIAEVVRFVDDNDVGEFRNALETLREVPLATEVGVAEGRPGC